MKLQECITFLKQVDNFSQIDARREEIAELIPAIRCMFDYDQQCYAHQYDLWEHSVQTLLGLPKSLRDDMVYLAALLHDLGKPDCQSEGIHDGQLSMHYYGHPKRSMEIVRDEVLPDLRAKKELLTEAEEHRLLYYVEHHDDYVSLTAQCFRKHWKWGANMQTFQTLMQLEVADAKAHVQIPVVQSRIELCSELSGNVIEELYQQVMAEV